MWSYNTHFTLWCFWRKVTVIIISEQSSFYSVLIVPHYHGLSVFSWNPVELQEICFANNWGALLLLSCQNHDTWSSVSGSLSEKHPHPKHNLFPCHRLRCHFVTQPDVQNNRMNFKRGGLNLKPARAPVVWKNVVFARLMESKMTWWGCIRWLFTFFKLKDSLSVQNKWTLFILCHLLKGTQLFLECLTNYMLFSLYCRLKNSLIQN